MPHVLGQLAFAGTPLAFLALGCAFVAALFARRRDWARRIVLLAAATGAGEPRLLLTEGGWRTRFILGDENSLLHKKTLFRLDA